MTQPTTLILDDTEPALRRLSDLGRAVIGPVARSVRQSIYLFASAHSWRVVCHDSFVAWAAERMEGTLVWLVLDPLTIAESVCATARSARIFRNIGHTRIRIEARLTADVAEAVRGKDVGLMDDVVASGATLRHATALVSEAGGRVQRFVTCGALLQGRASVAQSAPSATWSVLIDADAEMVHLRDVCPCLPFGGRRVEELPPIHTPSGDIGVVLSPTAFRGGPWGQLALDSGLGYTIRQARRRIAEQLSSALGRIATVADLPLLGPDVTLPLTSHLHAVAASSSLEELLR